MSSCSSPSILVENVTFLNFYISFHGGKHGVNTVLSSRSISPVLTGNDHQKALRSMLILSDGTLLVANSDDENSVVYQYSDCQNDGTRKFVGTFASKNLMHPYGLAASSSRLYVSSQDINTVNSFNLANGSWDSEVYDFAKEQIRGVAVDEKSNLLYVANKDANQLVAIDLSNNKIKGSDSINVSDPVGVIFDSTNRLLYVGSLKDNAVYSFDVDKKGNMVQSYTHDSLSHPAGIALHKKKLFVVNQNKKSVLQFDTQSGKYEGKVFDNLPDTPEQIIVSDC